MAKYPTLHFPVFVILIFKNVHREIGPTTYSIDFLRNIVNRNTSPIYREESLAVQLTSFVLIRVALPQNAASGAAARNGGKSFFLTHIKK
jgi:metal-dependent HD superfamily phosphatase/phosphodiesterase